MKIKHIHMLSLEDESGDSPGWGSWRCEVEYEDGTIKEGYCDGDEHNAVESTLELDEDDEKCPDCGHTPETGACFTCKMD